MLTTFVWRTVIRRAETAGATASAKHGLLLVIGGLSAVACLLLIPMVLGNTQAAIAPIGLTLLYG